MINRASTFSFPPFPDSHCRQPDRWLYGSASRYPAPRSQTRRPEIRPRVAAPVLCMGCRLPGSGGNATLAAVTLTTTTEESMTPATAPLGDRTTTLSDHGGRLVGTRRAGRRPARPALRAPARMAQVVAHLVRHHGRGLDARPGDCHRPTRYREVDRRGCRRLQGFESAGVTDVGYGLVPNTGHFAPEEAPGETWRLISDLADRQEIAIAADHDMPQVGQHAGSGLA